MQLSFMAIWSILFIAAFIGLIIGVYLFESADNRWRFCADELPPNNGRAIVNYPAAFFDDEFGIVVDQAEYHPYRADKWLTVPDGYPCQPFAWYDLPSPPHPRIPQDMAPRRRVDDYI